MERLKTKLFGKNSRPSSHERDGAGGSRKEPGLKLSSSRPEHVSSLPDLAAATSQSTTSHFSKNSNVADDGHKSLQRQDLPSTAQHIQTASSGYDDPALQPTQTNQLTSKKSHPDLSDPKSLNTLATEFEALNHPDLSRKLWDDAYDNIMAEEEGLVKAYLKVLTRLLRKEKADDVVGDETQVDENIDVSAELHDRARRQEFLQRLVVNGKARIAKAAKISDVVGGIAGFILQAKPMIDVVVTIPYAAPAAIPWAGVCVGLQMLSNPAKATSSNLAGIVDVANRMDWYCALTTHFLGLRTIENYGTYKSALDQLEQRVIELYKSILLYQMKSVCSYYKNQGFSFFLQVWNGDEWDLALQSVKDAEKKLIDDWKIYDKAKASKFSEELVDVAKRTETQLRNISQSLQDLMAIQMQMKEEGENTECLRRLLVQPRDFMALIEREKEELIPNASGWIYDDPKYAAFTNWGESNFPDSRLLWIKGDAGLGKTMLLIGIIRELSKQPAKLAPNLSYFFCQSRSKIGKPLNSATATLRSLIWMLLIQRPHLIDYVKPDFKLDEGFLDGPTAVVALPRIFKDMLKDANIGPIYFVVDALDECDVDLDVLIDFISASLSLSTTVKWLISSRPETDIIARLKRSNRENSAFSKSLFDLDIQSNQGRIDRYILQKLSELRRSNLGNTYDDVSLLQSITSMVKHRAEGNLLYLSLVFKEMKNVRGPYAAEKIRDYPRGLSALYDHKLTRIEHADGNDLPRCNDVLLICFHAHRDLSISELGSFVPWSGDPWEFVTKCESFLTVNENEVVSFVHKSARDYLRENLSRLQDGNIRGHADMARFSIHSMSTLTRDICGLARHGYGIMPDNIIPLKNNSLASIQYSCVFWVDHLCATEKENFNDFSKLIEDTQVVEFLEEHFLHWLECLSLLGKLYKAVESIWALLLVARAQPQKNTRFIEFLRDAERFVRTHGPIFERAPIQIYGSALVFSPTNSKIRNLLWSQRLPFIQKVKGIASNWSSLLQTIPDTYEVSSTLSFSSDSMTLAAVKADGTVQLWNTLTGVCRRILDCSQKIVTGHSLGRDAFTTFSRDGTVAVCFNSFECGVQLWDANSGTFKHTLDLEPSSTGSVQSAAFSPDGKTLACASREKKVRFWDTNTYECTQIFEGYGDSVTFSPDGHSFGTISGKKIRLWNSSTGKLKQDLETDEGEIRSFAFSPDADSNVLASGSSTCKLQIWDTATGNIKLISGYPDNQISSITFSSDGKVLAYASGYQTWLWELTTDSHKPICRSSFPYQIAVDYYTVQSVAFSPDGKTLATHEYSGPVMLWDAVSIIHEQNLQEDRSWMNSSGISSMALSPDGRTAAFASNDILRLFDITKWTPTLKFSGTQDYIRGIAFSPDVKTLLSISEKTIRIWDILTGDLRHAFDDRWTSFDTFIFSPDGNNIASMSSFNRINILDVSSLDCDELEGLEDYFPLLIALSSTSTMLALPSQEESLCEIATSINAMPSADVTSQPTGILDKLAFPSDGLTVAYESGRSFILTNSATDTLKRFERHQKIEATLETHERYHQYTDLVAFSPNGKTLATFSKKDTTIRLWDTATCTHNDEFFLDCNIQKLCFSNGGSLLETDRGMLDLTRGTYSLASHSPALFVGEEWILCGSQPLLWLPTKYRATSAVLSGSDVIIGCNEGIAMISLGGAMGD